jgi:hypothetical protein
VISAQGLKIKRGYNMPFADRPVSGNVKGAQARSLAMASQAAFHPVCGWGAQRTTFGAKALRRYAVIEGGEGLVPTKQMVAYDTMLVCR